MRNLAAADPARVARMAAGWEAWATATGVRFPDRFDMYRNLKPLGAPPAAPTGAAPAKPGR